jgi:hypothetical protein
MKKVPEKTRKKGKVPEKTEIVLLLTFDDMY